MNQDDLSQKPVRVRIAPSPTGDRHVGTAYIGLINFVFARQHGGQFIVRIEDTDQSRSSQVFEDAIFRSLRWTGLTWDEGPDKGGPHGPYRQSERTEIYQAHAEKLVENGHAYRCYCTSADLTEMRARQKAAKEKFGYDGRCRALSPADVAQRDAAAAPHVIRLKMMKEGESVVPDRLRGDVHFQNNLIDDQILLKSDGFPTYHLANVVDDHLMGISHVIRAEEWLISTPKHLALYQAFGWEAPEFIHLPLLRNKDKSKISKRKNPVSLVYYEQAGYLPEALMNFLALMGWTHPEEKDRFSIDEMIEVFELDRVSLGSPVFDLDKLKWLNGLYLRELTPEALKEKLMAVLFSEAYLDQIIPMAQPRMEVLEDFWKVGDFFFQGDLTYDLQQLIPKGRKPSETRKMLLAVMDRLEASSRQGWNADSLEGALRGFCTDTEWAIKEVFMTVRMVIAARKATPGLFETLEALGKARVRRRFQHVNELLKTVK